MEIRKGLEEKSHLVTNKPGIFHKDTALATLKTQTDTHDKFADEESKFIFVESRTQPYGRYFKMYNKQNQRQNDPSTSPTKSKSLSFDDI